MSIISGNSVTYTASQLFGAPGSIVERNSITQDTTDTLPDASDIISIFKGTSSLNPTNSFFDFWIYNNSEYKVTVQVGTNSTMKPGPTDDIQANTIKKYTIIVTSPSTIDVFNVDLNGQKIVTQEVVTNVITREVPTDPVVIFQGDGNISLGSGELANISAGGSLNIYGNLFEYTNVTLITQSIDKTYTAAEVLSGYIKRDTDGSNVTDTLPSAASIVSAISDAKVGTSFKCFIENNTGPRNKKITLVNGTGTTVSGDDNVLERRKTWLLLFVCDNISPGTEAVTAYIVGTLDSQEGSVSNITNVTSSTYTATETDTNIRVDTDTINQDCIVTLPTISTIGVKRYYIQDATGEAGRHNIIIQGSGSDTIMNSTTFTINSDYSSVSLYNDEVSNWIVY